MRKIVWFTGATLLLLLLAACGGSKDGDLKVSEGKEDGSFTMEAKDSGGGNVRIETGKSKLPDDFPKEVPIPDGAEIDSSLKTTSDQGSGYVVSYKVKKSPEECADIYRDFLKSGGYQTSELKSDNNITLTGTSETKSFFIGIIPDEENASLTTVTLTFGDNAGS
ncbi:hypothetical protein [Cohnella candidum]|uniref:Lipoprotein n=1 Tax=Cohnella candidum TaxID=2674991 RepID=A0A3G3JU43_9BACL|nr:hypothetical protein [Cohnella candidum]AYQ71371.1 hypothetical protein EAV92_01465 [Cohnella candidum]